MAAGKIIVLSLLISQAVSAPSGCIESCTSYQSSYRNHASSGYQDNAGLAQVASNLNVDYTRPGNWTEQNQYKINDGHGQVFEEKGQVVQGPKTVRFYRKNYTSSYSSEHPVGWTGLSQLHRNANSQIGYGGTASSSSQQREYESTRNERINSITSSSGKSARLEDFGEYQEGSHHAQGYHQTNTEPGNWRQVNSYKTDGGHGQVFEEEGQYHTGPKRVRYYKRNYTSSYGTGGAVIPSIDLQKEIEKLHQELTSSSSNKFSTNAANVHVQESGYGHQRVHGSMLTSGSQLHQTEDQQLTQSVFPVPTQGSYGGESHSVFEKREEGYETRTQPVYRVPTTSVSQTDIAYRRNHFNREEEQRRLNQFRQAETLEGHHSSTIENQMSQNRVRPDMYEGQATLHVGMPGHTQYREEWSSSSHTREGTNPHITQQGMYDYRNHQNRNSHSAYHSSQSHESYASGMSGGSYQTAHHVAPEKLVNGVIDLGHGADCAQETQQMQYRSQHHRNYKRGASFNEQQSEDLTQQSEDMGQLQQADEDDMQQTTGNLEFGQQSEDLTQQTGHLEFGQQEQHHQEQQHLEDLSQQNEDLTQQTMGKLEFGQHHQHQEDLSQQSEDLTQQTSGHLEFGQHHQHQEDLSQQNEDLTQQTSGHLEFGQHHQHQEDLSQQNEDLTQQTSGHLEFGQHHQHQEDLTQQNEDLTQQTSGHLEFGQHQQQSDDLTQQTSGHLEFGQQQQQSDDLTQQTSGHLEFGQQQEHQQHMEDQNQQHDDLTQQTSGHLEFGQQQHHQQHDDMTQQTSGHLEFGHQQQVQREQRYSEDFTQQNEDWTQRMNGKLEFGSQQQQREQHGQTLEHLSQQNEDLTQQTSGHLELGQEYQNPWEPEKDGQQHEDFTQQNEDMTQQVAGKLEFGQQAHHPWDHIDQNEDQTRQVSGNLEFGTGSQQRDHSRRPTNSQRQEGNTKPTESDDMTQQTSGKIEFGHQTQQSQTHDETQRTNGKLEFDQKPGGKQDDIDMWSQHSHGSEDFTQQTGKVEFGQEEQPPPEVHDPSYGSYNPNYQHSDAEYIRYLQQRNGKLELGQQTQIYHPWAPGRYQHTEDLSQNSEDLTQQVGKWEFGPHYWKPYSPENYQQGQEDQKNDYFVPQTGFGVSVGFDRTSDQTGESHKTDTATTQEPGLNIDEPARPKPAQKPKPRPRYTRPVQELSTAKPIDVQEPVNVDQQQTQNPAAPSGHKPGESPFTESGDTSVDNYTPSSIHVDNEVDEDAIERGNLRGDQGIGSSSTTSKPVDLGQQSQVNTFGMPQGNADHGNWLHKSNDATVGLHWHYTYHPSDLTNTESGPSYYPGYGYAPIAPQRPTGPSALPGENQPNQNPQMPGSWSPYPSGPGNRPSAPAGVKTSHRQRHRQYFQQEAQRNMYQEDTHQGWGNTYGQRGPYSQSQNLGYPQQSQNTDDLQTSRQMGQLEFGHGQDNLQQAESGTHKLQIEPRILEAYGGGPYEGGNDRDIYGRITAKPSVTFPPTDDSWDVREKPRRPPVLEVIETTPQPVIETTTETVPEFIPEVPPSTPKPRFWDRVGKQIGNTANKVGEAFHNIFG